MYISWGFWKASMQQHSIGGDSSVSFSLSQQLLLLKVKYQKPSIWMLHITMWGHTLECCLCCSFGACTNSVFEVEGLIYFRNTWQKVGSISMQLIEVGHTQLQPVQILKLLVSQEQNWRCRQFVSGGYKNSGFFPCSQVNYQMEWVICLIDAQTLASTLLVTIESHFWTGCFCLPGTEDDNCFCPQGLWIEFSELVW